MRFLPTRTQPLLGKACFTSTRNYETQREFPKKTQKEKWKKVSNAVKSRWAEYRASHTHSSSAPSAESGMPRSATTTDHSYCAIADSVVSFEPESEIPETVITDPSDSNATSSMPQETVETEETAASEKTWREGRRIVELGVLADGLSACGKCGKPLHLSNTVGETRHGFASLLRVCCLFCKFVNKVPTGKRHSSKSIWDVNTKAATGILHAGIGHQQLTKIMSAINVPTISFTAMKKREREVGQVLEKMAGESTAQALAEEIEATRTSDQPVTEADAQEGAPPVVPLTLSEDAGWQTRSSGRSYASLSGHATLFGTKVGKIVSYETRKKTCKTCDNARRYNRVSREHSCRKNWSGSAKAMEPDMLVSMIKKVDSNQPNAHVATIVGDEDTSGMAKARRELSHEINKLSDSNHIKKNLGNELYALKKDHKISQKTIRYLQKNFQYMLQQNKGNEDGIRQGLESMHLHPFGDHSLCSTTWCKHIENPTAPYKSLPFGKPLQNKSLQGDLAQIFEKYRACTKKLAFMASTQVNESFNWMVASKAPKRQFFSASESLDFRVSAAVLQKNEGHQYIANANEKIGLSPGSHTKSMAALFDSRMRKKRQEATTRTFKRRRLELKAKRMAATTTQEIREGDSYATSIGIEKETPDDEGIPQPKLPPKPNNVHVDQFPTFFFDLETTGLSRNSHITQIAAVGPSSCPATFNTYVLPKKEIQEKAQQVSGITCTDHVMYHNGIPVDSLTIKDAFDKLFAFLGSEPAVLIGHNIRSFDSHILLNAATACGKHQELQEKVAGFVDTLPLFQHEFSEMQTYKQQNLYEHLFCESYAAHDALADAEALQKMIFHLKLSAEHFVPHSFTLDFVYETQKFSGEKKAFCTAGVPF